MALPKAVISVLRVAPTLLAALGGPLAAVAAAVATAALGAWLGPADAKPDGPPKPSTPEGIVQAVQENAGDPEFMLALKQAEADLQNYEKELGFRFAELGVRDRDSARAFARDSDTAGRAYGLGWAVLIVDAVTTVMAVGGGFVVLYGAFEVRDQNVLLAVFTLMGGIVGRISARADTFINFVYGSSQSSKEKSDQIADTVADLGAALADAPRPAPAPLPAPAPPPVVVAPPVAAPVPVAPPVAAPVPVAPPVDGKPSRFVTVIDDLFDSEGGYSDHVSDPGGCTNMGITIGTLKDWRGEPVTCDDVRALTREEASKIYFAKYWNACSASSLPPGLDYIVFDFGVNSGVSRSAKTLQTVICRNGVEVKVDGVIGPMTLAAVAKLPASALIEEFHRERMRFYQNLSTWDTFGKGWASRSNKVLAAARADASASVAA